MNLFSPLAKLVRQIDQNMQQELDLLCRAAGAFVHHKRTVPSELGQVIGRSQLRYAAFTRAKDVMLDRRTGAGAKKIIDTYLAEMQAMSDEVRELLLKLQTVAHEDKERNIDGNIQ